MKYNRTIRKRLVTGLLGFAATSLMAGAEPDFDVDIYGYIKLDASYDTHRTTPGDLMFYVLPKADERKNEFNMTAKETRLGLNIRAPELARTVMSGKVEMDFYGSASHNSPNPRLRLGYLDFAFENTSVRAGQDWETFITVLPRIVNFSFLANSGGLGLRRPQLRVTQVLNVAEDTKLISKVAAARTISQDIDGDGQDDGAAAGFPTAQGNLAIETPLLVRESPARIGVSGHWGREQVDAYKANGSMREKKDYDTWSMICSLVLPVFARNGKSAAIQGTIWTGENLNAYFGGIGQGINPELERGIRASGGWAQLVLAASDRLNLNLGYGIDDPKDGDLGDTCRSRNRSLFASVFYTVLPGTTLAFEYTNMKTEYKNTDAAVNNRFQGAVRYGF